MDRRTLLKAGALLALGAWPDRLALAQSREETLRILAEDPPNSLDPQGEGVSRAALGTFTNVYDRLINFGRIEVAPGLYRYDYTRFVGELAEAFEALDEGRRLVFHLRRDATFHDGTPVTAEDVKWSFDRAVALPASQRQFATGSLLDPAQFTALDAQTVQITFERRDRYTLPNLALTFASVLNAALARQHATPEDPWASEWLRRNAAGGGAYRLESWDPNQQAVYSRFEDWKSGPLPFVRRALVQIVPAATSRAATLLKGDADIALQLPARDIAALEQDPRVQVVSLPATNAFRLLAFNSRTAPFDDRRVRQAIAYALPYEALFQAAVRGRGRPLYGAAPGAPQTAEFPQPHGYHTDLETARALLAEAGLAEGFETSFSYNVSDAELGDPVALLVQEALAPLGIKISIEKIPGAQWGQRLTDKQVPFFFEGSSAWFDDPDYFFRIFFQGAWRWNFGAFENEAFAKLVEAARWESDPATYDSLIKQGIQILFEEMPVILLWSPAFDAALAPAWRDFTYYIHGQVDFRPLTRG